MTTTPEFEVGAAPVTSAAAGSRHLVIAVGDKAVEHHRSNGQTFWLTYADERWAKKMLARVRVVLPEAYVYDGRTGRAL